MKRHIFWCFLCFIGFLDFGRTVSDVSKTENITDSSTVTIVEKLHNFTVGEAFSKELSFESNKNTLITISGIPSDASFVIIQVHVHQYNVTLSYDIDHLYKVSNRSIYGSNIGLYVKPDSNNVAEVYLRNDNVHNVSALLAMVSYPNGAPIPGGCNMEFEIEIAPYQKVVAGNEMIIVDAQLASQSSKSVCEANRVTHEMYRMYLSEQDFTPESYFSSIRKMLTVDSIVNNGDKMPPAASISPMRRVYSTYVGVGSVYAVVATYGNKSSAYVPAFTYACNPLLDPKSCSMLNDLLPMILCGIIFVMGFLSVFVGHKFFRVDMLLPTALTGGIVGYSISKSIQEDTNFDICIGLAAAAVCSLAWLWLWNCSRRRPFKLMFTSLSLGFLIACIAHYNIKGMPIILENSWLFWILFATVVLLVAIVMAPLSFFGDALTCAIFGGYAFILMIDYLAGSCLKYIMINTIKRVSVPGFNVAIIDPPYQGKDIGLFFLWAVLVLVRLSRNYCSNTSSGSIHSSRCCGDSNDDEQRHLIWQH